MEIGSPAEMLMQNQSALETVIETEGHAEENARLTNELLLAKTEIASLRTEVRGLEQANLAMKCRLDSADFAADPAATAPTGELFALAVPAVAVVCVCYVAVNLMSTFANTLSYYCFSIGRAIFYFMFE